MAATARFDPLRHPRSARTGRFIDTLARLRKMGAVWNEGKGTWTVDKAHRDDLKSLLVDLGLDVKTVKPTSSHTKAKTDVLPGPEGMIDVQARMTAMGGKWNADKRQWTVPRESQKDLERLLADMGVTGEIRRTGGGTQRFVRDVIPGPDGGDTWPKVARFQRNDRVRLTDGREGVLVDAATDPPEAGTREQLNYMIRFDDGTEEQVPEGRIGSTVAPAKPKPAKPKPPKPPPKPPVRLTPEQESLANIRALAEAMRAEPDTPGNPRPVIGETIHFEDPGFPGSKIEATIVGVRPMSRQVRIDPLTGGRWMVGSQAPDGTWGMSRVRPVIVSGERQWQFTRPGDPEQVGVPFPEDAISKWQVEDGPVRFLDVTSEEIGTDDSFGWEWDRTDEAKAGSVRTWQDETQVRAIGAAIREHFDKYVPKENAFERAQRLDALTERRRELRREESRLFQYDPTLTPDEQEARRQRRLAVSAETEEVRKQIEALKGRQQDVDALRSLLAEIRPGFGTGSFRRKGQRKSSKGMTWAEVSSGFFPAEWIERSHEAGQIKLDTRGGRGYYRHGGSWGPSVVKADNQQTMTHELAHRIQYAARGQASREKIDARVDAAAKQFHARRTREAGTTTRPLRTLLPGHGYKSDEVANDDKYYHAYVGREYNGDPKEIWTMGMEAVWHRNRYSNLQIKETDPELWDLIVGILAGVP